MPHPIARHLLWFVGLLLLTSNAHGDERASLRGLVDVGIEGVTLRDAGAVVVFVVRDDGRAVLPSRNLPSVEIRQSGARFEPDFLAVAVGQTVDMPNDDVIYHNVFSYSAPNEFDLGLYAAGELHGIRFAHAGLVRIYCSIHDEMDGLIFVSPSRLHSVVDESGRFSIPDVPPGRYVVHVWSERLPETTEPIEIRPGEAATIDLEIRPGAARETPRLSSVEER